MLLLLSALASPDLPPLSLAEHCELYELIHREQLGSRNLTDHGLALYASRGGGERDHTCPGWKTWEAAPTQVVVFEPPMFSARYGAATVDYTVLAYNHHWDVRRVTGREHWTCNLEHEAAGWRLRGCSETIPPKP